jgi:hypothetical protein
LHSEVALFSFASEVANAQSGGFGKHGKSMDEEKHDGKVLPSKKL